MIILDTNVISEAMRVRPSAAVMGWLDDCDPTSLYLTAITVQELVFGVAVMPEGKRRDGLSRAIETILADDFAGRVLPYDEAAARHYGTRLAEARRRGLVISVADAQIAAIALSRDVPVATRDHTPFSALGVEVIDPFGN